MIVRVTFSDKVVMFGDSYKPWTMQMDEYMRRCAVNLTRPEKAEVSKSKWVAWGGLKWCSEEHFQYELNREGCQHDDPDNPNPRKYADMDFTKIANKKFAEIMDAWEAGQRMLKINKLTDEEFKRYQSGELKITV